MGWKEWRQRRRDQKAQAEQMRSMSQSELADIAGGMYSIITGADSWLIPSVGWADTSTERLLTASAWCCTAIMGNSRAMAQLQPVVQRLDGRRWVEAEAQHPLWAFIDDPLGPDAELPYWSWAQLIEWIAVNRYVAGNAYMIPQFAGKRIYSVAPVIGGTGVQGVEDEMGVAREYVISAERYPADRVINVMATSPTSYWRGLPPIKAALNSIDLDYYAGERQKYHMRNKVAPGLIVSFEDVMGLTSAQREKLQEALIAGYQSAEDTGKPWVIGGAAKIHDPPKAEDLQYFDTRRFSREEILSVIGMPPPVAGVLDNAILSNFGVAMRLWWNGYLFPVLSSIYGAINAQVVRRLHPGYRLWYDLAGSDVALELLSARATVAQQFVTLGYSTNVAAVAAGLEMPEHPALDIPNTAMVVSGRINPDGSPTKQPDAQPSLPEQGPRGDDVQDDQVDSASE